MYISNPEYTSVKAAALLERRSAPRGPTPSNPKQRPQQSEKAAAQRGCFAEQGRARGERGEGAGRSFKQGGCIYPQENSNAHLHM